MKRNSYQLPASSTDDKNFESTGSISELFSPKYRVFAELFKLSQQYINYSSRLDTVDDIGIIVDNIVKDLPKEELELVQLRLDVTLPNQVRVGWPFVLAVGACLPDSSHRDSRIQISWSRSELCVDLAVQVNAPECENAGPDSYSFRLYPNCDSPRSHFQLIPKRQGEINIIVMVNQLGYLAGSSSVSTIACADIMSSKQKEVSTSTSVNAYIENENLSVQNFRRHLLQAMDAGLDSAEFAELLFNLGIDGDLIIGDNKRDRIMQFIQYYQRHYMNGWSELLAELFAMAPHIRVKLSECGCQAWFP